MKNTLLHIKTTLTTFITNHKKTSILLALVILGGGYYILKPSTTTALRYVTTNPTQGTLVSSISGTGQMTAETQIDLKPRVSSTVTRIYVKTGDTVKKGAMLFTLDARDAQKTVRNAQTDLATAKLNLQKLQEPPKTLAVIQAQNAIAQAQQAKKDADLAVQTAHQALLNSNIAAIPDSTSSIETPPTISGSYTGNDEGQLKITVYQSGNGGYFGVTGLIQATGIVSTTTAQPVGDTGLYIKFANNASQMVWDINLPNKQSTSYTSNYNAYQNALQNQAKTISSSDDTIAEQTAQLKQLTDGTDPLDIQTAQLSVTQKENALLDAQQTLSDYYITAPFDGMIATINAQLGQQGSSGTALGTIITKDETAVIPLNEVDVSKVKVGQKATLTFDAISDLSITGEVISVDAIGTVSSGVVNYNVKITLDTPDERIKSGMSVNASIITNVAQDVLTVPNTAVKTNTQGSYVEVFDTKLPDPATGTIGSVSSIAPRKQTITTGLSNDTDTQILSGIDENTIVVTKTITPSTTNTATPSLLSSVGGNSRGGTSGGSTRALTGK